MLPGDRSFPSRPDAEGSSRSLERTITRPLNTSFGYTDLVSQLEESKFLRLFRYLAAEATNAPASGPHSIGVPDAELQVMTTAGDRWTTAQNLFFQLEHLPVACWAPANVDRFFSEALSAAFTNLKEQPRHLNALAGNAMASPAPESGWPVHWSGIDSYYLFVTNVCDPALLSDDSQRYVQIAHDLYESILGLPRHSHPRFGIGNPDVFSERTPCQIQQFIVSLINDPSSYYLIAREGSISVVPVTEHGQYATTNKQHEDTRTAHQFATVTNAITSPILSSSKLSQFEELLNSPRTKEKDIQHFLRSTPEILFSLDEHYCELQPHICLYDTTGNRLIPDFMVRLKPESTWDLVELKMPHDAITVRLHWLARSFVPVGLLV